MSGWGWLRGSEARVTAWPTVTNMRSHPTMTDEQILARPEILEQLRAVAAGMVVRGAPAGETSMWAQHRAVGFEVKHDVAFLAQMELIDMPISGPPRMAPRGVRLLTIADGPASSTSGPAD